MLGLMLLYYIQQNLLKRKGECGSGNGYWNDKRKEHIVKLFQTFALQVVKTFESFEE